MSAIERFVEGRLAELKGEVDRMRAENERLRAAIREHRDQKGDDRCWLDDMRLYNALDEGPGDATLPPRCEFLESCERFWEQRQSPSEKAASEASRMTIGQLERELAACRAAREADREIAREDLAAAQEVHQRQVRAYLAEIHRLKATFLEGGPPAPAAPRPDRESLGRIVRETYRSAFADIVGVPPLLPPWDREDGRDGTREIERRVADAVAAAVAPPAPEAIVDVRDLRTDRHEVHAFAVRSDAEAFADAEPDGEERFIVYTGDWTWHGAAAQEDDHGMA